MSTKQLAVKFNKSLECNLKDIEGFLEESESTNVFNLLLDKLADTLPHGKFAPV